MGFTKNFFIVCGWLTWFIGRFVIYLFKIVNYHQSPVKPLAKSVSLVFAAAAVCHNLSTNPTGFGTKNLKLLIKYLLFFFAC